jgi:RNA polymerase sigma factor (sigma-70 family)
VEKSDESIMQLVKEGQLTEMSVLFERYHLRLFNFFLRMTFDKDISQDLTQNLFYRMIKYRHTFNNQLSFKSWIYQMARNIHTDYYQEQKKKSDLFVSSENFPADISDDNEGFQEEQFERLEYAFSELSNEQKELIVLSRYQGLKYEEISSIVNQSVPAIKVAMHRAIRQLRGIYFKQI